MGIGLLAAGRALRSRYFAELVIVGSVVTVAMTQLGWQVLARAVMSVIAWDNARLADAERQLRRQRMAHLPPGAVLAGTVMTPLPGASSRQRRAVVLGIGLLATGRVLRSRRFDVHVVMAMVALRALTQMAWKDVIRAVRGVIAWDNARLADLEKELQRQHQAALTQLGRE